MTEKGGAKARAGVSGTAWGLPRRRVLAAMTGAVTGAMTGALPGLVTGAAATTGSAAQATIGYVGLTGDPLYDDRRGYAGVRLRQHYRPLDGARLALRGARVLQRALGMQISLEERLPDAAAEVPGAARALADAGALAVLADLPDDRLAELVEAVDGSTTVIDVRSPEARWRSRDCPAGLLHTAPSRAMLADALAQFLRKRGWTRVLLLVGRHPDDAADAEAARRAAAKFGLGLADDRAFVLTGDPTRREESNIALITGGVRYDVVWLIDNDGEYGRFVPFATYHPRPVVGSEGLRPTAWHWTFERYGAPQLNRRFERRVGRVMGARDWQGWAAARAVVQAIQDTESADPARVAARLVSDAFRIDLYKGLPGSFRSWNGQLRQPVLLATHDAVTAVAPLEGFEHGRNVLDTLGLDDAEAACRTN